MYVHHEPSCDYLVTARPQLNTGCALTLRYFVHLSSGTSRGDSVLVHIACTRHRCQVGNTAVSEISISRAGRGCACGPGARTGVSMARSSRYLLETLDTAISSQLA